MPIERFKQALEGSLLILGATIFYFGIPYALISFIATETISFTSFIESSTMGMTINEFIKFIVGFVILGVLIGFCIPMSHFDRDFLICRWWR